MNHWIISSNADCEWVISNGEKTIVYGRGVEAYDQAQTMAIYANGKLIVNAINAARGIVQPVQPIDHTRPVYQSRG
jgi:hypothetical protein